MPSSAPKEWEGEEWTMQSPGGEYRIPRIVKRVGSETYRESGRVVTVLTQFLQ